ncbi:MAG TPA: hypothetical protein VEC99_12950, partial [Clostridia bacterium]|nr:hypothetical protein [Clostridia bacterium]
MRTAPSKTIIGLGLLLFLFTAAWIGYLRTSHANQTPLDKLVAGIRYEGPWYFQCVRRTHILQFLPRKWLLKADRYNDDISSIRSMAASQLRQMGTNAWPAVPALVATMVHKDIFIGSYAAEALMDIKADQHPEWNTLQKSFRGSNSAALIFNSL